MMNSVLGVFDCYRGTLLKFKGLKKRELNGGVEEERFEGGQRMEEDHVKVEGGQRMDDFEVEVEGCQRMEDIEVEVQGVERIDEANVDNFMEDNNIFFEDFDYDTEAFMREDNFGKEYESMEEAEMESETQEGCMLPR
ncbi:hypothetical protein LIER_17302 [Lithospermum erythrorhizon]|uniref:Uncharacterized protein n=1 Tax=Lithospermum erythrorhizon TaxID=34254 RepID=A0AAV3QCC7_LITER